MNQNTEIFIEQFNKLESALKSKLHKNSNVSFSALVSEASRRDPFIRRYKSLLDSFRELRNVLVHEEGNRIIATPTDAAVKGISKLVEVYTKPERLDKLFSQKVVSVNDGQPIRTALDLMKFHGHGNLPVYDKNGCIGLLSSRVVMKWLLTQYDDMGQLTVDLNQVKIKTVLGQVDRIDEVKMVARKLDVISFLDVRRNAPSPSGVYLLTENGKRHEKPLGIVTEKDVSQIYEQIRID